MYYVDIIWTALFQSAAKMGKVYSEQKFDQFLELITLKFNWFCSVKYRNSLKNMLLLLCVCLIFYNCAVYILFVI